MYVLHALFGLDWDLKADFCIFRLPRRFSPPTGYLMRVRVDQSAHQGSPRMMMRPSTGIIGNWRIMNSRTRAGLTSGDAKRAKDQLTLRTTMQLVQ